MLSSFAEKDGPAPHPSFSLNEPQICTVALSDLKWPESHCSLQKAPETQGLLWSRITSLKKAGVLVRGSNKGLVRTLAPVLCGTDCYHLSKQTHEGQAGVSAWLSAPWVNISFKQLQTNDFICYTQSHCGWTLCRSFFSLSLSLPPYFSAYLFLLHICKHFLNSHCLHGKNLTRTVTDL